MIRVFFIFISFLFVSQGFTSQNTATVAPIELHGSEALRMGLLLKAFVIDTECPSGACDIKVRKIDCDRRLPDSHAVCEFQVFSENRWRRLVGTGVSKTELMNHFSTLGIPASCNEQVCNIKVENIQCRYDERKIPDTANCLITP